MLIWLNNDVGFLCKFRNGCLVDKSGFVGKILWFVVDFFVIFVFIVISLLLFIFKFWINDRFKWNIEEWVRDELIDL